MAHGKSEPDRRSVGSAAMPKGAKARSSRSQRAGLVFPVSRLDRLLHRGRYAKRIGSGASVYMAAVLQFITSEIMSRSVNITTHSRKRRISPQHLAQAIESNSELASLLARPGTPRRAAKRRKIQLPPKRVNRGKKRRIARPAVTA